MDWGRPLPPELLSEMHKCLPLGDAVNILVNVPSKVIVINNKPRMLRNVRRLKTFLNEYIGTLVTDEAENNRKILWIHNHNVKWNPQLDALLHYGRWMKSIKQLSIGTINSIVGMPENFMEELLLHLANSRSTSMMPQFVQLNFGEAILPIPTFLKQLLNMEQYQQIGRRFLFDKSFALKTDNGRTLHIFDGELIDEIHPFSDTSAYELKLILMNKMERKNWFKITICFDPSKKFIRRLELSHLWMQSLHENGKKFNSTGILDSKWDLFLRRGTAFTQFRHFKAKREVGSKQYLDYFDFLISYISNTKHPAEFLESIDIRFGSYVSFFEQNWTIRRLGITFPSFIHKIWNICQNGIPKGGKFINVDTEKLHFLSAKAWQPKIKWFLSLFGGPIIYEMKFTLANIPTNGAYVFDFNVKLEKIWRRSVEKRIVGIKIQKRKVDKIVGLECDEQIEPGKKSKKQSNEEEDKDKPTCSSKIMKK